MKAIWERIVLIILSLSLLNLYSVSALNNNILPIKLSVDNTPPVTTYTLEGERFGRCYLGNVTLSFSASDEESGVRETWIGWHLGGGAMIWETYTNPIIISRIGVHYIDYWSIDNAGNREDSKSLSFTIIEDIGYLLAMGNFTESITRYSGQFQFMFFIGFDDKEFKIITDQEDDLLLEKGTIITELLATSRIIFVKIAKLPSGISIG